MLLVPLGPHIPLFFVHPLVVCLRLLWFCEVGKLNLASSFAFQVSIICVRVPATCGSTEVCTDLPV